MAKQPRGPDGKWACVPSYPRQRTSSCGCGGGGLHPCRVGKKLAPVRAKGRKAYVPTGRDLRDIEELERELYGVELETEATASQLDTVRSQIASAGSRTHRARDLGRQGNTSRGRGHSVLNKYGEDSERAYEELLHERADLRAHQEHLRREVRDIRQAVRDIRAGKQLSGAARTKLLGRSAGFHQANRPRKYHPHAIPQIALRDYLRSHPGATANEAQVAWQEGEHRTKLLRTADRSARRGGQR